MSKLRKLTIVIEDTGEYEGKGFNVSLVGDKDRIGIIPEEQYSPAEFWGSNLYKICLDVLREAGVVKAATVDSSETKH